MQRLAKRAAQAQRQATRQGRLLVRKEQIDAKIRNRTALRNAVAEVRQNIKDARQARQEDWELGPLAPKRDLGFNNYGAFQENLRQDWTNYGLHKTHPKTVQQRCAWAGGPEQLNLAVKDRVVLLDGPDKGKIDQIKSVNAENGTVTLENHHRALSVGMFNNPSRSQAMPIAVDSVRLVYPLPDPETGVTRDVVINQLKSVPPNMQSPNMSLDRWQYGNKWDRVVPSLNVTIPWPEVEVPEFEAKAADCVRETVNERTFYYGLLSPPMPEQVLDELRNKYSRFRTRHEEWYVEQKEAEAEAKERQRETVRSMQTPVQEFNEMKREMRAMAGEPELTEEMLEKIGEVMASKKAAALDQAGVSEVSSETKPSAPQ
ncbi:hypothetical protein K4F52_004748 [Lecanicillium sp. MT-2017a]|nr:hypothetical protein K4F52_004748 [Lecanicillium sp. MT-2017a]